jgi:hypothetical protein
VRPVLVVCAGINRVGFVNSVPAILQENPGPKTDQGPRRKSAGVASAGSRHRATRVERGNDHNGCNGCTRRSLGFAPVRTPDPKPLQTGGFSEHERTGANACQLLPCRRSWVRVPSSALESLQIGSRRRLIGKRWLQHGCTRRRIGPELCLRSRDSPPRSTLMVSTVATRFPANRTLAGGSLRGQPPGDEEVVPSAKFTDFCRRSSYGVVGRAIGGSDGGRSVNLHLTTSRSGPRSTPSL